MKKLLVIPILVMLLTVAINTTLAEDKREKVVLYGGVVANVPKTPEEVTQYLIKMKAIMREYEQLANSLMTALMSGGQSAQLADSARTEWIRLANKIDSIAPPSEVSASHKQLAASLRRSSQFLTSIAGVSADQKQQVLTAMVPVISDLAASATSYQQRVSVVIKQMGLDPALNPLGTDTGFNSAMPNLQNFGF